ncbi:MAG: hypothetical protein H7X97_04290 [Opitutaceae bacterium]|nr:hypothetical protein [Verrucomicrobiales bacterium]
MNYLNRTMTLALIVAGLATTHLNAANWTEGMTEGAPALKSISQLAFGPDGILFVADSKSAAIVAIATADTKPASGSKAIKVDGINQKVAALLGTAADQILIDDLVVNPLSHNIYLAVSRGRGPAAVPVLVKVDASGQLEAVSLDKVKFSRAELPDAPVDGVVGNGQRQSNPRQESITDIAFLEDRLLIAGLSNEEFSSTLRAVPFPFKTVANGTSVEIYHGAHGKFETRSPIRTFVAFKVGNQPSLLAAYTCTPLVQFPISDLKPGAKIKGKTIAELGNRNRPIDMIVYQKGGKDYILMANSSRGVMKISTDNIEKADSIEKPVGGTGIQGQAYETIEGWKGVDHLDRFDAMNALVLRRGEGASLNLESLPLP